jgi:phosphoenolpyruvate-protein phosphotransferase/dihydroxyacetone kinase phosphotransfer subunit
MVGIVIVSHSKRLAEGVKELAVQMTQGKLPIEIAAGIDDLTNPIGTDSIKVLTAIKSVHAAGAEGILVLMDLGSALMSAETALDFLPEGLKKEVRLCAAPLVEGAISAAVQASMGASLDNVAAEALAALAAKQEQLFARSGDSSPVADASPAEKTGTNIAETRLIIRNRIGLHARPAAKFVTTAGKFESSITVFKGERSASAKSINQIATLAALKDDEIRVRAVGPDAKDAIAAIAALNAENFGEKDEEASEVPFPAVSEAKAVIKGLIHGVAASPGVAVGRAYFYRPVLPEIAIRNVDDPETEIARLAEALTKARKAIEMLGAKSKRAGVESKTTIFDFHRLILDDPDLVKKAQKTIRKERINAEAAWLRVMQTTLDAYRSLDNAYMQARAADVIDAGNRVFSQLSGQPRNTLLLEAPAVIVAYDLFPSEVAQLDPRKVLGLVTAVGGSNSHAAILARSLGIPAVIGAGPAVSSVVHGAVIALDGNNGEIWLSPDPKVQEALKIRKAQWLDKKQRLRKESHKPAVTTDGVTIHITANIGIPRDASEAFKHGAEGVGLFRTEFLFQQRETAPKEDEQHAAYVAAAKAMKGHPVIIRTLDVGADKALSYVIAPRENNPALGERGIRFCLAHRDVFKPQLKALLRAAQKENIKIMFPMVARLAELRAARTLLEEAKRELGIQGIACSKPLEIGIMIEVPAAVAMADRLAKEADFFSIGTNDLTQYVMAADRGNAAVVSLCDSFHPAVLRMVRTAVEAGHRAGIPVNLCGELAGNPDAAPLLIGFGLDELSMNAHCVPEVKAVIRKLSAAKCRNLAKRALKKEDSDGVRQLLKNAKKESV